MSWETEKRKLYKSNEKAIKHNTKIERQKNINSKIDLNIKNLNQTNNIISKFYNISQDWKQLVSLNGNFDSIIGEWEEDTVWSDQALGWNIQLGVFDIRLLPYIKADFIFKPVEEIDKNKILEWVNSGIFYSVETLEENNEFLKNVTMHLTCQISKFRPEGDQGDYQLQRPWKVKTLITLINPRLFI